MEDEYFFLFPLQKKTDWIIGGCRYLNIFEIVIKNYESKICEPVYKS